MGKVAAIRWILATTMFAAGALGVALHLSVCDFNQLCAPFFYMLPMPVAGALAARDEGRGDSAIGPLKEQLNYLCRAVSDSAELHRSLLRKQMSFQALKVNALQSRSSSHDARQDCQDSERCESISSPSASFPSRIAKSVGVIPAGAEVATLAAERPSPVVGITARLLASVAIFV